VNEERTVQVPDDGRHDRLDRWLPSLLDVSRSEARRLIDAGGVYVDGKRCRVQSRPIGAGASIRCVMGAAVVANKARSAPEPRIVYRDEVLLVVDKPAGVPSQATRATVQGTVERWASQLHGVSYVALHHRLDRDAQGLLALAVDRAANRGLAAAFGERTAIRRYRVMVGGEVEGDAGTWHHTLDERGRSRYAVEYVPDGGKEMLADWAVLGRAPGYTLLQVTLRTGRTHQIRLQSKAAGHMVVGDTLHGAGEPGGLRLQAFGLSLAHPVSGEPLSFELPIPPDWGIELT